MSEERTLYRYPTGQTGPDGQPVLASADPLEIHLKLTMALGNGANHVLAATRKWAEEPATAAEARLRVIEAARQAFDLPGVDPHTGEGVPLSHVEKVALGFFAWCAKKNGSTESPPICSPAAPPGSWPDPAALPAMDPTPMP